ncbi:MGMT family protein [Adlercreutzia sp. ZJ242]|uniref:MGMT family protein n=1 Tax=Adlercreutzia sp. ZJ242 TaxID=2709409 RepID=UPI002108414B|nr:MGMT family protein [Adlercreutzia sp. ZJ242]
MPLAPIGSEFRQAVWQKLLEIPYGELTTYGAIAQALKEERGKASALAVGFRRQGGRWRLPGETENRTRKRRGGSFVSRAAAGRPGPSLYRWNRAMMFQKAHRNCHIFTSKLRIMQL